VRLLGRRKPRSETRPVPGRDDLILVRKDQTDQLCRKWADELFHAAASDPLPDDVLTMLQVGLLAVRTGDDIDLDCPAGRDALLAGQTAARLGFRARGLEFEKFHSAREVDVELINALDRWLADPGFGGETTQETLIEAARTVARTEPLHATYDDDGALLWNLPGIGGDARWVLADYCVLGCARADQAGNAEYPDGAEPDVLRRVWVYGYFLRVMLQHMSGELE
jgi:hypothetical protein